jgi:hypothetical protein
MRVAYTLRLNCSSYLCADPNYSRLSRPLRAFFEQLKCPQFCVIPHPTPLTALSLQPIHLPLSNPL